MDSRKQELKKLKKARRRAKRKYVSGWKALSVFSLVVALLFTPLCFGAKVLDNAVAAIFGGTFWKLTDEDKSAVPFPMDFTSHEALTQYGQQIQKQVAAEGTVLLMNENNALPLKAGAQVSCFFGSTHHGDDALKAALEKAGFGVNQTLLAFYRGGEVTKYALQNGMSPTKSIRVPFSLYTDKVKSSVTAYGDAAIAVMDKNEVDLLQGISQLKKTGKVQKIVVLINTPKPIQLDFLKGNPYGVDAVLWIGDVCNMDAVAEILTGKVNPSGSLAGTCCYDNSMQSLTPATLGGNSILCREGIYTDYKYYETRYEDFVMDTGNPGSYVYGDTVAYPFGFGLSYTAFDYSHMGVTYDEKSDRFEVRVTVTNSGDVAGKETVQVYAQSPYTDYDKKYGVEKAAVNLVGFAKTGVLEPGKSVTVTVYIDKRDLASYDAYGKGTYMLDAGNYYLTVATDAHRAVNNILAAKGYTPVSTNGRMDDVGDAAFAYKWEQAELDADIYAVAKNGTPIFNRLACADPNRYMDVKRLSRQDWEGTWPKTSVVLQPVADGQYDPQQYPFVSMPTLGAQNGMKLYDLIGVEFDDLRWQTLLDQLTFDEMVAMVGDAFQWRMPVESVQAPGARDGRLGSGLFDSYGEVTAFPSQAVMASTFHTELLYEVGKVIGNDCLNANVVCLYGLGGNLTEYSEDGFLAGKICAAQVRGIQDKGVDVAVEGLPFDGMRIWLDEQTARERYLQSLRYVLEEGRAGGIMTAGTYWGTALLAELDILRQEWGNHGMIMTGNGELPGVDGLLAGITAYSVMLPDIAKELSQYRDNPAVVSAMRQACHYNLYALVNSSGMNGIGAHTTVQIVEPMVLILFRVIALCGVVLFVIFAILWSRGKEKWKRTAAYLSYRTMKTTLREEKRR